MLRVCFSSGAFQRLSWVCFDEGARDKVASGGGSGPKGGRFPWRLEYVLGDAFFTLTQFCRVFKMASSICRQQCVGIFVSLRHVSYKSNSSEPGYQRVAAGGGKEKNMLPLHQVHVELNRVKKGQCSWHKSSTRIWNMSTHKRGFSSSEGVVVRSEQRPWREWEKKRSSQVCVWRRLCRSYAENSAFGLG